MSWYYRAMDGWKRSGPWYKHDSNGEEQPPIPNTPGKNDPIWSATTPPRMTPPPQPEMQDEQWPTFDETTEVWKNRSDAGSSGSTGAFSVYGGALSDRGTRREKCTKLDGSYETAWRNKVEREQEKKDREAKGATAKSRGKRVPPLTPEEKRRRRQLKM